MGIHNFIRNLFGKPKTENVAFQPSNVKRISFAEKLESERQERIAEGENEIRKWVPDILRSKGEMPFSWDSGNDEAFLSFVDKTDDEEVKFDYLVEYIINKLNIPSAGEFKMNGRGTIYLDGNLAKVKYCSVTVIIVDYNEQTEEEVYSEEEQDSGDMVLFVV